MSNIRTNSARNYEDPAKRARRVTAPPGLSSGKVQERSVEKGVNPESGNLHEVAEDLQDQKAEQTILTDREVNSPEASMLSRIKAFIMQPQVLKTILAVAVAAVFITAACFALPVVLGMVGGLSSSVLTAAVGGLILTTTINIVKVKLAPLISKCLHSLANELESVRNSVPEELKGADAERFFQETKKWCLKGGIAVARLLAGAVNPLNVYNLRDIMAENQKEVLDALNQLGSNEVGVGN